MEHLRVLQGTDNSPAWRIGCRKFIHKGFAMKRGFNDQGWSRSKRGSTAKSNGEVASPDHKSGELIQFTQLSRDVTKKIEIEKSLRELSLKINRTQEAERLQIDVRLHGVLVRSLALMKPSLGVGASAAGQRRRSG
jgi:hypothetical protein